LARKESPESPECSIPVAISIFISIFYLKIAATTTPACITWDLRHFYFHFHFLPENRSNSNTSVHYMGFAPFPFFRIPRRASG